MAEIAGVALGVASLVIAAIQSYKATYGLLSGFKHAPKRLREAMTKVRTQELSFRKANERLLGHFLDVDDAKQMLRDPDNRLWQDQSLMCDYVAHLGDDVGCFEDTVALVHDKLESMSKKLRSFSVSESVSGKSIRKQLKFAFEQSNMEKSLSELVDITQNFVALTELLSPQYQAIEHPALGLTSPSLRREMQRFTTVKRSAEDLYRALGSACNDHENHKAILSLTPDYSDTHRIRFTLAFTKRSLKSQASSANGQPIWLTIQSTLTGRIEPAEQAISDLSPLATRPKRALGGISEDNVMQQPTKLRKRVRFQDPTQPKSTKSASQVCSIPSQPSGTAFFNLCTHGKICHHLAKFTGLSLPPGESIGYLELSSGSKHLVYLDSHSTTVLQKSVTKEMKSLSQLFTKSKTDNLAADLPLKHRLELAKQLARGILHFHTTAWLQDAWDSQSILVSERSTSYKTESINLPEAYAMTRIDRPSPTTPPPSATPSPLVVRNRLLFSLGIVLLELAYQRPLASLTIDLDRINIPSEDVPFRTADRLTNIVGSKISANYAELVRKCLHCDFANGFDLSQMRLQEAFYRSVVCELDTLARALA